jgi:biopolymer transport protein ExbB
MDSFILRFLEYMQSGGFVMWPLFLSNLVLWYGLGSRYFTLHRGRKKSARTLIASHKKNPNKKIKGILDAVIRDSIFVAEYQQGHPYLRQYIDGAQSKYYVEIKKFSTLIKTLVMIAPLIGLLGTVIGMIETFDSLSSQVLFSQGGGIAGGISQALFTTQLGLVVAVPGLIIGRILDKKEQNFRVEFEQIKDILASGEQHAV